MGTLIVTWLYRHRTLCEVLGAILLTLIFFTVWTLHAETLGAAKCEEHVAQQNTAAAAADVKETADQADAINAEAKQYAADTSAPTLKQQPGPNNFNGTVQLCRSAAAAAAVHGTAAAGSNRDANSNVSGAARSDADRGVSDIERIAKIGQQADAQVRELQSYIKDVCHAGVAASAN